MTESPGPKRAKLDLPPVTVLLGEELKDHVAPQLERMAKSEVPPADFSGICGYDQNDLKKALKAGNGNAYDCRVPMHWFPRVWWMCVCVWCVVCVCVCVCGVCVCVGRV